MINGVTVGITGATGFLGGHVRARLLALGVNDVRLADRPTWGSPEALDGFVSGCGAIVHAAGTSRGRPDEVRDGNVGLAEALAAAKRRTRARFGLAFANSVQATGKGPYSEAKREASETLAAAQAEAGDPHVDVVLPHLFGEGGRPHHNSVMATFAEQLAHGDEPRIIDDIELDLVHAQDAAGALVTGALGSETSVERMTGRRLSVSEALSTLERLARPYLGDGSFPEMRDRFETRLFNMFHAHLNPARCPRPLVTHTDPRGTFFETVRAGSLGQASVSTTRPGVTRGDHFHLDRVERFVVASGQAVIRIRRLFATRVHEFAVSGRSPAAVDIPTLHAHNITNTGDGELVTMFWGNDHFDPDHPDTVPLPVEQSWAQP